MVFFGLCLGDSGYGLFCLPGYNLSFRSEKFESVYEVYFVVSTSTCCFDILYGPSYGNIFGANIYDLNWPFVQKLKGTIYLDNNQMFRLSLILGAIRLCLV